MEVGAWFVQGLPILARPAPGWPVPSVQIVERARKIDDEKKRERLETEEGGNSPHSLPVFPSSFPPRAIKLAPHHPNTVLSSLKTGTGYTLVNPRPPAMSPNANGTRHLTH